MMAKSAVVSALGSAPQRPHLTPVRGPRRARPRPVCRHAASTRIPPNITTIVAEPLGYRAMTEPRHASDLDALLRQVGRRDTDAFAALYDRTRSRVYGLISRVLRDAGYS